MNTHGEGHGDTEKEAQGHGLKGLSLDAGGFLLSPVRAPGAVGDEGELVFEILDDSGEPVTDYDTAHEKDLHLIVVRTDGAGFRHVHPVLDASTGTWSTPWSWDEAGTYRVYADFTPAAEGAEGVTLSRSVQVAGDFAPVERELQTTDEVDGYAVSLHGEVTAGSASELTVTVERDGEPVTTLEPYLGAFGHMVALREGDLAYLHVHAEGDEPHAGDTAGPEIRFAAKAPTAGRYMVYLDFQVDGQVHTAEFVIEAARGDASHTDDDSDHGGH
ncbi:hypothetical protein [Microbacterium sp. JZ31]|uniref:hypothetical protein n=1 Tax=Microbacterium sp. JZ31 TaxID=1906274 RepID=UPI001EE41845|nr:hypothetical protein [Microbacterium sp. JZ31]